ncbi:MAG: hypothetical protein ACIWVG_19835 [Gloeotrichia echinulata HAB0833]
MVAWYATSPSFDYCFLVAVTDVAGASNQEREMFRFKTGIPTGNDG